MLALCTLDFTSADHHRDGNEIILSGRDYGLQSNASPFASKTNTRARSFTLCKSNWYRCFLQSSFIQPKVRYFACRHQLRSIDKELIVNDPNRCLMDPERRVAVQEISKLLFFPSVCFQFFDLLSFHCRSFTLNHYHNRMRFCCFARKLCMHMTMYAWLKRIQLV